MKIALLNLPYDNNYGGNLQRYALMKVLQDMGHEVTHIKWCKYYHKPWYKIPFVLLYRLIKYNIHCRKEILFYEYYATKKYNQDCKTTDVFYERYIKHSESVYTKDELEAALGGFDAYVVGSDQVWRKKYTECWLPLMMMSFADQLTNVKRLAYAVSFGNNEKELAPSEQKDLAKLYSQFDGVSVREDSALDLMREYGWTTPSAIHVLDPTLLLTAKDYEKLIEKAETNPLKRPLFCYILDPDKEKDEFIEKKSIQMGIAPFKVMLEEGSRPSIEQWLRYFRDADYIITDSYHGYVFSKIFNKPCHLFLNAKRGNARFESLQRIESRIDEMRTASLRFIEESLK